MVEEDVADVDGHGNGEGIEHLREEELLVIEAERVPELDKGVCDLVQTLV